MYNLFYLEVTNIHDIYFFAEIVGTKDYRKPEWVAHMEEMQEALKGRDILILNLPLNNKNKIKSQLNLKQAILNYSHIYIQYLDYAHSNFFLMKYKLFWFGMDTKIIKPAYIFALKITLR